MENSSDLLGSKGLIKKLEFVRIIIQCLYALGYSKSASLLELESGISFKFAEFQLLESQILNGDWDGCVSTLNLLKDMIDETRESALFLVFRQCLLEYLSCGQDSLALNVLRKQVATLHVDKCKVHSLANSLLSLKDAELGLIDDTIVHDLRRKLLTDLEKLLPPPITVPERRLEHLVESTLTSWIDSCMYNCSSNPMNDLMIHNAFSCVYNLHTKNSDQSDKKLSSDH
ncbi:hypothetical protein QN277_015703 [Acacia crassicarpa]|uniref:CTLH domain-containing protein n=1 Tax=Acacia crassicarpa TaxID=499986 RepID=A0AAE1K172_9FABA|nr:hypothetical protein QN277_015703 [Acacia crassicarpa]